MGTCKCNLGCLATEGTIEGKAYWRMDYCQLQVVLLVKNNEYRGRFNTDYLLVAVMDEQRSNLVLLKKRENCTFDWYHWGTLDT